MFAPVADNWEQLKFRATGKVVMTTRAFMKKKSLVAHLQCLTLPAAEWRACNSVQFINAGETKPVGIECTQPFDYNRMHHIWASPRLVEMGTFAIIGEAMLQGVVEQRFAIMVQNLTMEPQILKRDTPVSMTCEMSA
jgi:hypothetical protein